MSNYDNSTQFGSYLNNSSQNRDVWAYIDTYLADAGLGDLSGWAQELLTNYGAELTQDQFTQAIRETDTYKTRFKAIEIAKKNGQPIPTEAQVLQTEMAYQQIMQEADMPPSFYDEPDDYANLIGRGVSPNELQTRIIEGYTAVRSDPGWQAALKQLYGVGGTESDLVAFFLDPDRGTTAIQKRQAAASIANRSNKSGFGQLSLEQAEKLSGQNVTDAQAQQGFNQLGQQAGLFTGLASENGNMDKNVGLRAAFDGSATDQDALTRRRAERQANFQAGGQFQVNRNGNTGAGTSNN